MLDKATSLQSNIYPVWRGAGACVLFTVVAVAVRGVRWDETWEHAQILTGQVVYPEGHPLALYVHNAFSLQTYISAGMLYAGAGPALVCGFRNVLFLLASVLPVYALTATLTRSVLAGLLAALLMMQGVMLEFDGSYPTMVWPEIYSNGHIGGGVVLLALAALVAGRFRRAFFLLGLIPCIHVGQWPPLAVTVGLFGGHALMVSKKAAAPRAVRWAGVFLLGLCLTALFWVVHRQFTLPLPASGPFAAGGDTEAVWRGYTTLHDPHRRFPPGNGHVILAGTILLAWLLAIWGGEHRLRRTGLGLALYTSIIGLVVWGTMAVHAVLGPDIPFLLIAWMPYRMINHVPAIALSLMVALILTRWPTRGWRLLAGAAAIGMLQPLWPWVVGETFHRRYLAGGECVPFLLYGASLFAVLVVAVGQGARWRAIALAAAPIMPLAMYHRFGAACVVAGIFIAFALDRKFESIAGFPKFYRSGRWAIWKQAARRSRFRIPVPLIVAGCALILIHQAGHRQQLPASALQERMESALFARGDVCLLAPPDSLLLQATTNYPVLADVATPSLISYVPAIGPSIESMYSDIYGISFRLPEPGMRQEPTTPWQRLWRERDQATWVELSRRYEFTLVLAPVDLPLQLTEILADESYALYAVGR
ncbi:MAG: hypothetical protein JNK74_06425 [Candidatus Hydrogenedentes bacterium]|nr:hypothetical protein [Candidatus Hydrogenedentota bacterium]